MMKTDILIIGGGLSGLALAWHLEQAGTDYILIEARSRFGGRIHSQTIKRPEGDVSFDLGPAWFWPGQPRIAKFIADFGLKYFDQYYQGELVYEDGQGPVQRGRGFSSMQGSYRLSGSFTALIEAFVARLPREKLLLNQTVTDLSFNKDTSGGAVLENAVQAVTTSSIDAPLNIQSHKVVLALPPRVAAETIRFKPEPTTAIKTMLNIPTWMAGHAKVMAIYERPFWREAGLSGDAMSRIGPMVEIHDASPEKDGPYALFGFVGTPADIRLAHKDALIKAAKEQLIRLFGAQAANPLSLTLQDWAGEKQTAISRDYAAPSSHPHYGLPNDLKDVWNGCLIMGSTETGTQFGGYLEGALEAAEAVRDVIKTVSKT